MAGLMCVAMLVFFGVKLHKCLAAYDRVGL